MTRVLSISHSYVVAVNRALPNALAGMGWDVTVAAPRAFPGDLSAMVLEPAAGERARLVPIRLRWPARVHLMTWGGELRELLAERWDVVHAWEEPYIPAGAQVARWRQSGALVFATFQNISKWYPPPFSWCERYAMSRADAWIAWGGTVDAALASRSGYAGLPHRVIPPAIDLDRFRPDEGQRAAARDSFGFGPDDCVVGFAGRFVPQKGLSVLTAALDRVRAPWRALFIGGGPLEGELASWAKQQDGRARIATGVTHARMPRYLNAMDLLAVPSRTTKRWREQFGRVIAEAMACGVAVVGSDSGEIPHVIGEAGIVVPESGGVDAWTRVLEELIGDVSRARELASRGVERARDFGVSEVARQHARFFSELIGR